MKRRQRRQLGPMTLVAKSVRSAVSTRSDMVRPCLAASRLSWAMIVSSMLSVVFIWETIPYIWLYGIHSEWTAEADPSAAQNTCLSAIQAGTPTVLGPAISASLTTLPSQWNAYCSVHHFTTANLYAAYAAARSAGPRRSEASMRSKYLCVSRRAVRLPSAIAAANSAIPSGAIAGKVAGSVGSARAVAPLSPARLL